MDYNKETHKVPKTRSAIVGRSGPRDLQRKQKEAQQLGAVTELRDQISQLTQQLATTPPPAASTTNKLYSAEEFDEELNKVIAQVTTELKARYAKETDELLLMRGRVGQLTEKIQELEQHSAVTKAKLEAKDEMLKVKDDTITTLKDRPVTVNIEGAVVNEEESDRPKMEQVFINPMEDEDKLDSHLTFKDIKVEEGEEMSSKVDKLKGLLGGLPK